MMSAIANTPFTPPPTTRTPLTEAHYHAVVERLERRFRQHLAIVYEDHDAFAPEPAALMPLTPTRLADFFLRTEHEFSRATARLYRAALRYVWWERGDPESLAGIERLRLTHLDDEEIFVRQEELRRTRRQATGPRTAERKTKQIAPGDWQKLLAAIAASRSRWKHETVTWLEAGALTGLRPAE